MNFFDKFKKIRGIVLHGVLVGIFTGLFFGYSTAIIDPSKRSIMANMDTHELFEYLTASILLGAFVGSLCAGFIADKFGRKFFLHLN